MKKLSLYAFLLIFILASCDQKYNATAKSKYKCGKATLIVEKIGENDIEEHLLISYEGDPTGKQQFGKFSKKANETTIFEVTNINDSPHLMYETIISNKNNLKYWYISKFQWTYVEPLINNAKEKRLSEKGSEKHIYAERILFDALMKITGAYMESDIKPTEFKFDCK
jgi:hypothetical protein